MNRLLRFVIPFACLVLALIFIQAISVVAHTENIPAASSEGWTSRADMPIPSSYLGGDTIDGKIYVVGGYITGTLDTLFSYDPLSDTWQTLANLPSPRVHGGTIAEEGKLYVAGGRIEEGAEIWWYGDLYAYTPGTNTWDELADMPEKRCCGGMAAWQGKLYYAGGSDENDVKTDTVYEYDTISDTWTLLTTLPEARNWVGAAVVDGILYVVGGEMASGEPANTMWAYDHTQDTWYAKAPLPVAQWGLEESTKSYNGKIYVLGGYYLGGGMLRDVEVYDPLSDSWEMLPDLPKERTGVAAAVLDGELHAIGGYSFNYGRMADHTALQVITPTFPTGVTISGMDLGMVGESYSFTATVEPISTTLSLTYTWQADGQLPITHTSGLTDTASFTWDMLGTHIITATASNLYGSVLDSFAITITDQPIEGLTASNDSPIMLGEVTTLTATIASGTNVSFTWGFGDDSIGSGQVVTHTYPAPGLYTATVTATNSVSSLTETTLVTITAPVYQTYLPLVFKSSEEILAPTPPSSPLGGGAWLGMVIVGVISYCKRRI
jgi:N-acetylneuraminic acid mutarotase